MEHLMARYGPTAPAPAPDDPNFASRQQVLHLGEAGSRDLDDARCRQLLPSLRGGKKKLGSNLGIP